MALRELSQQRNNSCIRTALCNKLKIDPEFGKLSVNLTNNEVSMTQLWVIDGKMTDLGVIVDPELNLIPMDSFRVTIVATAFRVYPTPTLSGMGRGRGRGGVM